MEALQMGIGFFFAGSLLLAFAYALRKRPVCLTCCDTEV